MLVGTITEINCVYALLAPVGAPNVLVSLANLPRDTPLKVGDYLQFLIETDDRGRRLAVEVRRWPES
jgi:hypothetical protein